MRYFYITLLILGCCGCGNRTKKGVADISVSENYDNTVNVINQAKPKLMVMPSDKLLKERNCIKAFEENGKEIYVRNIPKFLIENDGSHSIINEIQKYFISIGYPLNNLEQSLKSINNQLILDDVDGIAKDAKTLLLTSVSPDIILEIDYHKNEILGRTTKQTSLEYSVSAIDVYSNKVIASVFKNDIKMDLSEYIAKNISDDLEVLESQIRDYFIDIVRNGREISFRVVLSNSSTVNLSDIYNSQGDSYSDWIRRWVITHAKNGSANMIVNTEKEMSFSNVRISNIAEDGTQFNAYEFASAFRKDFYKTFSLQSSNNSQGLGNAVVVINK